MKRNPECWIENIQESPQSESNGEECGEKIENFLGVAKPDVTWVKGWEGELDSEGRFHGKGVLTLNDCDGQTGCETNGLESLVGFWKHGLLSGPATLNYIEPHPLTEVVAFKRGKRQGLGVVFLDRDKQHLAKVTRWQMGSEVGPSWDLSMGHGFDVSKHFNLVSAVKELPPTAHWGGGVLFNSSVWLYPDLKTALVGNWGKGVMGENEDVDKVEGEESKEMRTNSEEFQGWGRLAEVEAVRCTDGILEVGTGPTKGGIVHKYERPTSTSVGALPNLEDPYERTMVKVGPSRLGGQGLHMRTAAPTPGTLLAYFSGILVPVDSLEKAFEKELGAPMNSLQRNDSRLAAYLERKSYVVALDMETDIDIPPELRDTKSYNATLGHKVNHWPLPNSYIGWGIHPRFGRVRAIVSLRSLQRGEEVGTSPSLSSSSPSPPSSPSPSPSSLPSDPAGDCGLWLSYWRTCHASLVHQTTPQDTSELALFCIVASLAYL